jgi:hypothetical protein
LAPDKPIYALCIGISTDDRVSRIMRFAPQEPSGRKDENATAKPTVYISLYLRIERVVIPKRVEGR